MNKDLYTTKSDILTIVPAYNESGSIVDVVEDIKKTIPCDVLVIDDGSYDNTAKLADHADAYVLKLPFNLGIGGAVQAGFKYAAEMGYSFVVRLDGDGQHRAGPALTLLKAVQDGTADVAIGSRFIPGHITYNPPLSRALGIKWFALMISWITGNRTYDPTSGMQALNRRGIKILAENYPQDYPEVEARILLKKSQLTVIEFPVDMKPRSAGLSSITYIKAIYYMFKVTLATVLAALRRPPRLPKEEI